jgi:hypothetical protein
MCRLPPMPLYANTRAPTAFRPWSSGCACATVPFRSASTRRSRLIVGFDEAIQAVRRAPNFRARGPGSLRPAISPMAHGGGLPLNLRETHFGGPRTRLLANVFAGVDRDVRRGVTRRETPRNRHQHGLARERRQARRRSPDRSIAHSPSAAAASASQVQPARESAVGPARGLRRGRGWRRRTMRESVADAFN